MLEALYNRSKIYWNNDSIGASEIFLKNFHKFKMWNSFVLRQCDVTRRRVTLVLLHSLLTPTSSLGARPDTLKQYQQCEE